MADSEIVKPSETKNVSELFLNHAFKICIPRYQREYVWEEEQWSDLLEDISSREIKEIFLGFLLVHHEKDGENLNVYNIVDGQQRILTLSILFSVLAKLEEESPGARPPYIRNEVFKQTYKGTSFKKVSANIGKFFLDEILYKGECPKDICKSEKLLSDCYIYFSREVREIAKTREEIEAMYDRVKNNITFSVTSTNTYQNAVRLFQVLNDNSVKLSSIDLFKNSLLSNLGDRPDSELDEYAEKWNDLNGECSKRKITLHEYLLRFSMSNLGYFKKNDLYEQLVSIFEKKFNKNSESFLEYLVDDISFFCQIYSSESAEIELQTHSEIKLPIKILSALNVSEPITFFYTLLSVVCKESIEGKNKLIRNVFFKFLHFTIVRYKLNGSGRAYMHNMYPSWSMALREFSFTDRTTLVELLGNSELCKVQELNSKYFNVDESSGISTVESEILQLTYSSNVKNKRKSRNDVLIKYLLCIYYFGDNIREIERAYSTYSIEHIANDSDNLFGDKRFTFGNLMLVSKDTWGNADFNLKIQHYKKETHLSSIHDPVLKLTKWTEDDVNNRGNVMAKQISKFLV